MFGIVPLWNNNRGSEMGFMNLPSTVRDEINKNFTPIIDCLNELSIFIKSNKKIPR